MEQRRYEPVYWPTLRDGPNEPGPTDLAGEYYAREHPIREPVGARVPGEVRPLEQPIDVASQSKFPAPAPSLSSAERDVDDPRHIARGKGSMSSSEGSS